MYFERKTDLRYLPILGAHATVKTWSPLSPCKANSATGSHLWWSWSNSQTCGNLLQGQLKYTALALKAHLIISQSFWEVTPQLYRKLKLLASIQAWYIFSDPKYTLSDPENSSQEIFYPFGRYMSKTINLLILEDLKDSSHASFWV